jgi:hypothetical protein
MYTLYSAYSDNFQYLARIQQTMMYRFNPSVNICYLQLSDATEKELYDNSYYTNKYTLPDCLHETHLTNHKDIIVTQTVRCCLDKISTESKVIGWIDADIIPFESNSIVELCKLNSPIVAEHAPLNNLHKNYWTTICNWYGFDYLPIVNSGLVIAPKDHEFWEKWQQAFSNLYKQNLERFLNYESINTKNTNYYETINGMHTPLWFIDQISLSYLVSYYTDIIKISNLYNYTPLHIDKDIEEPTKSAVPGIKNFHLISSSKKCFIIEDH